ncbi:hypothetical protein EVAR_80812_1 [Eumeta japonica]|uniref:Uncharacterized protein n=1 Tax=Eumeta variegata TaxID=151549 RepID=A0A4C1WG59_EUMVA|nr:hypothetical protein EVAR_80812_1 [Eumeta japonica]
MSKAAPKCPITDRSEVRRYDAKARAEVIAEHLAEQFTPNPPPPPQTCKTSCTGEEPCGGFMATTLPSLQEICSSPQLHSTRLSYASPKSPRTGRHVYGRAEASPRGDSGHEQSVQRNTPHWSLPEEWKGENHNDTQSGKRPA